MNMSQDAGKPIGEGRRGKWLVRGASGTASIYKSYAESFRGADHLRRILEEAQEIVGDALVGSDSRVQS